MSTEDDDMLARVAFNGAVTNSEAGLDKESFKVLVQKLYRNDSKQQISKNDLNDAFELADADNNGVVDIDEFSTLYSLVKDGKVHGLRKNPWKFNTKKEENNHKKKRNDFKESLEKRRQRASQNNGQGQILSTRVNSLNKYTTSENIGNYGSDTQSSKSRSQNGGGATIDAEETLKSQMHGRKETGMTLTNAKNEWENRSKITKAQDIGNLGQHTKASNSHFTYDEMDANNTSGAELAIRNQKNARRETATALSNAKGEWESRGGKPTKAQDIGNLGQQTTAGNHRHDAMDADNTSSAELAIRSQKNARKETGATLTNAKNEWENRSKITKAQDIGNLGKLTVASNHRNEEMDANNTSAAELTIRSQKNARKDTAATLSNAKNEWESRRGRPTKAQDIGHLGQHTAASSRHHDVMDANNTSAAELAIRSQTNARKETATALSNAKNEWESRRGRPTKAQDIGNLGKVTAASKARLEAQNAENTGAAEHIALMKNKGRSSMSSAGTKSNKEWTKRTERKFLSSMGKFENVDTDGSGSIDINELRAAADFLKISVEEVESIFKDIDVNGDGEISVDEFMAYFGNRTKSKKFKSKASMHTKASLKNSDVNGQFVSERELSMKSAKATREELSMASSNANLEWKKRQDKLRSKSPNSTAMSIQEKRGSSMSRRNPSISRDQKQTSSGSRRPSSSVPRNSHTNNTDRDVERGRSKTRTNSLPRAARSYSASRNATSSRYGQQSSTSTSSSSTSRNTSRSSSRGQSRSNSSNRSTSTTRSISTERNNRRGSGYGQNNSLKKPSSSSNLINRKSASMPRPLDIKSTSPTNSTSAARDVRVPSPQSMVPKARTLMRKDSTKKSSVTLEMNSEIVNRNMIKLNESSSMESSTVERQKSNGNDDAKQSPRPLIISTTSRPMIKKQNIPKSPSFSPPPADSPSGGAYMKGKTGKAPNRYFSQQPSSSPPALPSQDNNTQDDESGEVPSSPTFFNKNNTASFTSTKQQSISPNSSPPKSRHATPPTPKTTEEKMIAERKEKDRQIKLKDENYIKDLINKQQSEKADFEEAKLINQIAEEKAKKEKEEADEEKQENEKLLHLQEKEKVEKQKKEEEEKEKKIFQEEEKARIQAEEKLERERLKQEEEEALANKLKLENEIKRQKEADEEKMRQEAVLLAAAEEEKEKLRKGEEEKEKLRKEEEEKEKLRKEEEEKEKLRKEEEEKAEALRLQKENETGFEREEREEAEKLKMHKENVEKIHKEERIQYRKLANEIEQSNNSYAELMKKRSLQRKLDKQKSIIDDDEEEEEDVLGKSKKSNTPNKKAGMFRRSASVMEKKEKSSSLSSPSPVGALRRTASAIEKGVNKISPAQQKALTKAKKEKAARDKLAAKEAEAAQARAVDRAQIVKEEEKVAAAAKKAEEEAGEKPPGSAV